ncbi:hypothetical protein ILUMI_26605 [Ignelater luminosus]|uniref:Uncharacterized protein n=1 Tax=Ignelater luminosus TaxID=2038154 RepID=A0A8K0C9I4_IGNLU|nr:hypothetical protein ILUMI_26605 [Ignelater luminosus]
MCEHTSKTQRETAAKVKANKARTKRKTSKRDNTRLLNVDVTRELADTRVDVSAKTVRRRLKEAGRPARRSDRKCKEIDTYIGGNQCTEVLKFINSVKKQLKECGQYHKNLLTEDKDDFINDMNMSRVEIWDEYITFDATRCLKNGKASDPEDITAELLKNGTEKHHEMFATVFSQYLNSYPVPDE